MGTFQDWLVEVTGALAPVTDEHRAVAERTARDIGSAVLAAQGTDTVVAVQKYTRETAGQGPSSVWGTSMRVDPVSAALANGAAAQCIEYDDFSIGAMSHVGSVMVPATVAMSHEIPLERSLDAFVVGLMVIKHASAPLLGDMYIRGIQPTQLLSTLGAISTLLYGLDVSSDVRRNAFGLVATQFLGLRSHTGTSSKGIQFGMGAAAAVRAVMLARHGATAGTDAVDVVLRVLGYSEDDLKEKAQGQLVAPAILAPRLFSTNGSAHTAIEATIRLRERFGDRGGDPSARIIVTCPPRALNALSFSRPVTADQSRFSMPYAVAIAWMHGEAKPRYFIQSKVDDPAVKALMDRVEIRPDEAMNPPRGRGGSPASVRCEVGGRAEELRIELPLGYPERPISEAQFEQKFVECATDLLGADGAKRLYRELSGPAVFRTINERLGVERGRS